MRPAAALAVTVLAMAAAVATGDPPDSPNPLLRDDTVREVTSEPAFAPATRPAGELETVVRNLSDPRPAIRDAARTRLMTLSYADLPTLLTAARNARPLTPATGDRLADVVFNIVASRQPYRADVTAGFIGVTLGVDVPMTPAEPVDLAAEPPADPPEPVVGVLVAGRLCGWPAYAVLRDGDVVTGVGAQVLHGGRPEFTALVRAVPPRQVVELRLLRGGRPMTVRIPVSARPSELPNDPMLSAVQAQRRLAAVAYWKRVFAPELPELPPVEEPPDPASM